MNLINKLERKFGRYAIQNLMFYIVILYAVGYFIFSVNAGFYYDFLALDVSKLFRGQIWRLFTFIIFPPSMDNILFIAIELYLYYMIGSSLENAWGAFRFNLYFLSGILFNIIATIIMYLVTGNSFNLGLTYINQSMFLAFAALFPNVQLLLFFVIPVKVKYLGYLSAGYLVYEILVNLVNNNYYVSVAIIVALGNFLIFFFSTRNYRKISPSEYKRKSDYRRKVKDASNTGNVVNFNGKRAITRHKCAVCGRTELDDDNLEFRFCSKCDGNYEYCMDHLFTHEHVKKPTE